MRRSGPSRRFISRLFIASLSILRPRSLPTRLVNPAIFEEKCGLARRLISITKPTRDKPAPGTLDLGRVGRSLVILNRSPHQHVLLYSLVLFPGTTGPSLQSCKIARIAVPVFAMGSRPKRESHPACQMRFPVYRVAQGRPWGVRESSGKSH